MHSDIKMPIQKLLYFLKKYRLPRPACLSFRCLVSPSFLCSLSVHAQLITAKSIDSKVSFQDVACLRLLAAQDTVDVEELLEKGANGPCADSFIEFWTAFECRATSRNDIKVPPIYNTINNPEKNEHFPKAAHDYFIEERGDQATWLRMINTPTPQLMVG